MKVGIILKIGVDLDGVITPFKFINPSIKLPQVIYILLAPISLLVPPANKAALQQLKKQGHVIIIVSARPWWFHRITESWLKLHKVTFDKLYCIGFGKGTKRRKLKIIEKEHIEIFIEDDKRIRDFLAQSSVKVAASLYEIFQAPSGHYFFILT